MVRRQTLLLAIAFLLCAAALFAIVVLLVGRFGPTEARIVGTTAAIAGCSLLALPAVLLTERGRWPRLAALNAATAAATGVAAVLVIWWDGELFGKVASTALFVAAATTQASALLARSRPADPPVVRRLFAGSIVSGSVVAAMAVIVTWAQFDSPGYARLLGATVVLDVLLVALQPLLARLQPRSRHYVLELTLDDGGVPLVEVDAPEIAAAAAQAIRGQERRGAHVTALRVVTPR